MKIDNRTHYDSRPLKSLAVAVHNVTRPVRGSRMSARWAEVTLRVEYAAGPYVSCEYVRARMTLYLRLPKSYDEAVLEGVKRQLSARTPGASGAPERENGYRALTGEITWREIAWSVWHGVLRMYGISRSQYEPDVSPESAFGWADEDFGPVVPLKASATRPKPRVAERRYQRVLELEAAWTRKKKLAETKLTGLRAKRRYYERMLKKRPSAPASAPASAPGHDG